MKENLTEKIKKLQGFFYDNPCVAVAFSGGVDSSYLLYAALRHAKSVRAYYVKSEFQPAFEYEDALRLAGFLGMARRGSEKDTGNENDAELIVLPFQALADIRVVENPQNRCYYCKQGIFGAIRDAAAQDGFDVLLDGTNASDDAQDRPGMKALQEMMVHSPLRECGLTKDEIRLLSKEAGLFTWDKPAYACLATRIPSGEEITEEKLRNTEAAEAYLFSLGFKDFRVRSDQGRARIQLREEQIGDLLQKREEVLQELSKYYKTVALDLAVRNT